MYSLTHSSSHVVVAAADVRSKDFKTSRFVVLMLILSIILSYLISPSVSASFPLGWLTWDKIGICWVYM